MKLVIQTQYCENYGSADKPYWKFKGGDTYIVQDLNADQAQRILRDGIPTLKALIQYKNAMSEVSITNHIVVDDDVVVTEDYETPYILSWENNTWVCRQVDTQGPFVSPVTSKITKFTLGMRGENTDTTVSYKVEGGQVIDYKEIDSYLKNYDKA